MIYLFLLFAEVVVLFLLSQSVNKTISRFLSINFISIIFSPGVIIHELSHFIMAIALFVPVGNMEFSPKKIGNSVKLGSVEIAKTDPIRRSLIGFAPVFMGIMVIIGLIYLFNSNILFFQSKGWAVYLCAILVTIYLLFAVANTMFSSRADMKGTLELLIVFFIVFALTYVLGFRPQALDMGKIFTGEASALIEKSALFLLAPIAIDIVLLGIVGVITRSRTRI